MATEAYYKWVRDGRRYKVARPIFELGVLLAVHNVPSLGVLGSDDVNHLQAAVPKDHCPFSFTAWPDPLPDYIVCARDAENVVKNGVSLGDSFREQARVGRTPWCKYFIYNGWGYHCRDGFMQASEEKDIHFHVSSRTDHLYTSIGDLELFGVDMDTEDKRRALATEMTVASFTQGMVKTVPIVGADGQVRETPIIPNILLTQLVEEVRALRSLVERLGAGSGELPGTVAVRGTFTGVVERGSDA